MQGEETTDDSSFATPGPPPPPGIVGGDRGLNECPGGGISVSLTSCSRTANACDRLTHLHSPLNSCIQAEGYNCEKDCTRGRSGISVSPRSAFAQFASASQFRVKARGTQVSEAVSFCLKCRDEVCWRHRSGPRKCSSSSSAARSAFGRAHTRRQQQSITGEISAIFLPGSTPSPIVSPAASCYALMHMMVHACRSPPSSCCALPSNSND